MVEQLTVQEAAKRLGTSEGAIRQRLHRGSLQSTKGEDGRVYVIIPPDDNHNYSGTTPVTESLVDELRDRIRFLESELNDRKEEMRRKDTLLAQMNQTLSQMASRIPELEPASAIDSSSEVSDSPVTASEEAGKGQVPPEPETTASEPWWRRIFR